MEAEMDRHTEAQTEVVRGTIRVRVADVASLARHYARLGLRIIRETRDRALVELPCGATLVLSRRAAKHGVMAAA
jgi:hypothetical protein